MEKLITRQIINKNLSLQCFYPSEYPDGFSPVIDYHSVSAGIDFAKSYMLNVIGCKPGEKVILALNWWPEYLHWFFACAELGLVMVVIDYPRATNYRYLAKKLELYGGIDYVVFDENRSKDMKFYNVGPTQPTYISPRQIKDYDFSAHSESVSHKSVYATPDSSLIYATSSGTTGTPKVIAYSHKFFHDLMLRNIQLYKLTADDKCIHTKLLHHGSVVGVYFLPTIFACETHYHTVDQPKRQQQLLNTTDITRVMMFPAKLIDFDKVLTPQPNLTVYSLAPLSDEYIDRAVGKKSASIVSVFGCTETSGPLFLPEYTPLNYSNRDRLNMGQPLDQFYKLQLNSESLLTVTMPDGQVICTGDSFAVDNRDFIFQGRSNLYRINDVKVDLADLNHIVEQHTGYKSQIEFDIVADQARNCIFIRSDSGIDLHNLNSYIIEQTGIPEYCVVHNLVMPREQLVAGIKFNAELVRMLCREHIDR